MTGRQSVWFACGVLTLVGFAVDLTAVTHETEPSAVRVGPVLTVAAGTVGSVGAGTVAYNSVKDEFFVVWHDHRDAGSGELLRHDIYGRRVSVDGGFVDQDRVVASDEDGKFEPMVVHDPVRNHYLVTWTHQGGAPGSPDFNQSFGRLVTDTGAAVTDPQHLSVAGFEATAVFNPALNQGEFFVSARAFAPGVQSGIYGERISHTGSGLGTIGVTFDGAPAPTGQVALNGSNSEVLVTWRDQMNENLMGRIVEADGGFVTDSFELSSVFPSSGLAAGAAFDLHHGRYFVVFGDFFGGPVRGQFVAADGTLDGEPVTLIDSVVVQYPYLAYDPGNRLFLLVWHSTRFIYCQLVSLTGQLLGDVVELTSIHQSTNPRVAASSDRGGFLVAWQNTASMSLHVQLVGIEGSSLVFVDGFEVGAGSAW